MPSILLIGPGAIGGLVATRLCLDSANDVALAARTPFERLCLETADGPLEATPRVLYDPAEAAPVDWVLVATKSYDSAAASAWFPGALGPRARLAVLQNGVDHVERFAAWAPRDRILPVVVDCPVERTAPGRLRQRGPAVLTVPAGTAGEAFASLFARTGVDCRVSDDFVSVAWWKLCLNAAGVVNALTGLPAHIAHDGHAASLMRSIVEEAAAVGRAEGARLAAEIADEVVGIYRDQPPDSVNSLLADRLAGGSTEIDLRNGVVVEHGRRHGIPTPYNEMAVALLKVS